METRKIQQVSGGTYTVSLPSDWVQSEGISRGDTVGLHAHIDGLLVVQPPDRGVESTGSVSITLDSDDTEQVTQILVAAYTAGHTEITLTARDEFTSSLRRVVRETTSVLAGATVTTVSPQTIQIRVPLDSEEISVRQLVRQLSFLAVSMHQRAMAAVSADQPDCDLVGREDQADRLFALTKRSFTRALFRLGEVDSLGVTRPELFELWATARNLERVADHAERIGTIARRVDDPSDDDDTVALHRLARRSQAVVDTAVRGVVDDEERDTVPKALALRDRVRESVSKLDRRLFGDASADYRLTRILDSVRRTAEHGGNIAEWGLQRWIRRCDDSSLNWSDPASAATTPPESSTESDVTPSESSAEDD